MTGTQLAIWAPEAPAQLELDYRAPATAPGPAPVPADDRCSTCHRSAHRPGLLDFGHHGHAYTPPAAPEPPAGPCAVCARLADEDHQAHTYRPQGTPRPRGEVRFPVGSLVKLTGGPKWSRGCVGIVTDVVSTAMRQVSLGQLGAPGMWDCIGIRGLELCDSRSEIRPGAVEVAQ